MIAPYRLLLTGLLAVGLASPIHAEAEPSINIAGQWTFTARLDIDCTFHGTASLRHQGDATYSAEITAVQSCPALEADFVVRQDCAVSQMSAQISVRCEIVEFINGFDVGFYYPDNFALSIDTPARMHGALISTGDPKPAEWRRAEGAIS